MSKRKITLKQFCQLFVDGTMLRVVSDEVEKFCQDVRWVKQSSYADNTVNHCYIWNNVLWVVLE